MIFNIVHTTSYEYSAPAIESYTELRVRPRSSNLQIIHRHVTEVTPRTASLTERSRPLSASLWASVSTVLREVTESVLCR
jgi:transglutaminase-like putative cysteine protease